MTLKGLRRDPSPGCTPRDAPPPPPATQQAARAPSCLLPCARARIHVRRPAVRALHTRTCTRAHVHAGGVRPEGGQAPGVPHHVPRLPLLPGGARVPLLSLVHPPCLFPPCGLAPPSALGQSLLQCSASPRHPSPRALPGARACTYLALCSWWCGTAWC